MWKSVKVESTKLHMEFNIGLSGISSEYPISDDILLDAHIRNRRTARPYFTGKLTDQPHEHGTIYTQFSTKTAFRKDYVFYVNLLMEHRGESYGGNDLNNIVVVPQMYGRLQDSIRIWKEGYWCVFARRRSFAIQDQ